MNTFPSGEAYWRYCDEQNADARARSHTAAVRTFCEHDRNRTQHWAPGGAVAEAGASIPLMTILSATAGSGYVVIHRDGGRAVVAADEDERSTVAIVDLERRLFGPAARP